jgi:hypothetical protein
MAPWRPADEAEAAGNMAAFIEWRRAVAGHRLDGPAAVRAWAAAEPAAFEAAVLRFAGVEPGIGHTEALARAIEGGAALLMIGADPRRPIGAGDMRVGRVPPVVAAMLGAGGRAALAGQAADHLLRLDLRPDQRLLWPGPADGPWPLAALLAGATLLLCETPPADPGALAAAEGAALLRRPA